MKSLDTEIQSALALVKVNYRLFSGNELDELWDKVRINYTQLPDKYAFDTVYWLWEFTESDRCMPIQRADGRELLCEFFHKESHCVLFSSFDRSDYFYYIEDPSRIFDVLDECYGFEYYLTDTNASYLVTRNHHEVLLICGRAIIEVIDKP